MAGLMNRLRRTRLAKFLYSTDGPTATEYAIMLAVIILVSVAAIQQAGGWMSFCYDNIATAVATVGF
jgi:pilus assembly protein Flp/PilA